jgi:hypothetical protein
LFVKKYVFGNYYEKAGASPDTDTTKSGQFAYGVTRRSYPEKTQKTIRKTVTLVPGF